jgi:hypothetical protein
LDTYWLGSVLVLPGEKCRHRQRPGEKRTFCDRSVEGMKKVFYPEKEKYAVCDECDRRFSSLLKRRTSGNGGPKWEYQCVSRPVHCKFEWCCGPECACVFRDKAGTEQERKDVRVARKMQEAWRRRRRRRPREQA